MSATITAILPYLQFLAGSGSGWAASWLFDQLRDDWLTRPYWPAWAARFLEVAFYHPLGARATVFVLTAIVAVSASVGVALITGQPLDSAADTTIASLIAILLGQMRHAHVSFPSISVDLEGGNNELEHGGSAGAGTDDRQH